MFVHHVDASEEKKPVVIGATMKRLKEIDVKMVNLNKKINVYMRELGLLEF
jgi:hypothetical protein